VLVDDGVNLLAGPLVVLLNLGLHLLYDVVLKILSLADESLYKVHTHQLSAVQVLHHALSALAHEHIGTLRVLADCGLPPLVPFAKRNSHVSYI
jgi:hypothetical protein